MEKLKQIITDTGIALKLLLGSLIPVIGVALVLEVVFGIKPFNILQNLTTAFEALGGPKQQFHVWLLFGAVSYVLYFRK